MKTINTNSIRYIDLIPDGTDEWYYGISDEHGDLYESEELFKHGQKIKGRDLCFVHYPDGTVYRPLFKKEGRYLSDPVYLEEKIYFIEVSFTENILRIYGFDCKSHETEMVCGIYLDEIRDLYNVMLHTRPLCLTRQGGEGFFEIIWPERISFKMGKHESFFLRDGNKLYFSKWYEEGEGTDYRYWEETVVRDLEGKVIEVLMGDVKVMPDGQLWHLQ